MGKLPTIAVCYIAAVDNSQLEERRGPSRMTDALPEYNIVDMRDRTPEDLSPTELEQLQDVEVAFILYMPDWLLAACPKLKWIHSFMTGHDHIPLPQLKERNIRLHKKFIGRIRHHPRLSIRRISPFAAAYGISREGEVVALCSSVIVRILLDMLAAS
jgi:hypothetical protein